MKRRPRRMPFLLAGLLTIPAALCPTCPCGSGGGSDHAPVATTIRRWGN